MRNLESTNLSPSAVDQPAEYVPTPMQYMDGVAYLPGNAFSIMAVRRTLAAREQAAAGNDQPSADNEPVVAAALAAHASNDGSVTDMNWILEPPPRPAIDDDPDYGQDEELALLAARSDMLLEILTAEQEEMDEAVGAGRPGHDMPGSSKDEESSKIAILLPNPAPSSTGTRLLFAL